MGDVLCMGLACTRMLDFVCSSVSYVCVIMARGLYVGILGFWLSLCSVVLGTTKKGPDSVQLSSLAVCKWFGGIRRVRSLRLGHLVTSAKEGRIYSAT